RRRPVASFRSRIPTPPILCLRFAVSLAVAAQDSRPSGPLLLSRKALSSSTSCRFIPAHRNVGFARLAIFRPGIIVGNAHTPAWVGLLGSLVPGPFGNIDQRILGRSIAAEIALHSREAGEVIRENAAMKKLATQFNSVTLAFLREV